MSARHAGPPTRIDDAGLVRAPRWLVHRRVVDLEAWPLWWPGLVRLRTVPDDGRRIHHLQLSLARPLRPRHVLRVAVLPHGHRPGNGMRLVVSGDVVAEVEFWLEDVPAGTLVHHLATVDGPNRHAGARWREVVRRGLWALADRLAAEVRDAVLLDPA